jgi:hypothetical protein
MTRLWALAENARRGQEADLGCPEPQARASVIVGSQRHLRLPLSDSACGGRSDTTPPQDHSQKIGGADAVSEAGYKSAMENFLRQLGGIFG